MAKGKHAYAKQRRAEREELDRRKKESFWGKVKSESECVAELMRMYQELVEKHNG